jgi:tetratricopeptide (TPR) repeat protein
LADYHRALRYEPDNSAVLLEIAELHRQLNDPDRSLANLQCLSDNYPPGEEPQQVLYLTGLAYMALGRHGDAIEALAAARDRGPASSDILCRLALAQWSDGRHAEARETAQLAARLSPGHRASLALLEQMRLARDTSTEPATR